MQKKYLLLPALFCAVFCSANAQITLDSTVVDTHTVINTLNIPWEIKWGPDNWIWTTERHGRVSRINPATGVQEEVLDLSASVYATGEAGLLGMTLHPDFANNGRIFLVYTYMDGTPKERLVSYEYNGSILINPDTLIEGITANTTHDGSRLLILPDETILMTTGDAQAQGTPQDLNSLNGKVLRLNLDGSIPADNPIAGSPVWSWGHRNAQGLMLAPNGKIYSSEHGPSTDDELNLLEMGRNYGWPDVHGFCDEPFEMGFCTDSNVFEPLTNWTPTIATSDIAWYDHPAIPEFRGSILMAVLKNKRMVSMKLNAAGTEVTDENHYFINTWGRLRDLLVAPDGSIYIATNGPDASNPNPFTHAIIQIKNSNHPVGVQQVTEAAPEIWPQPAREIIHISLPDHWVNSQLELREATGKLIETYQLMQPSYHLEVNELPSGLYFLTFKKEGQVNHRKILID